MATEWVVQAATTAAWTARSGSAASWARQSGSSLTWDGVISESAVGGRILLAGGGFLLLESGGFVLLESEGVADAPIWTPQSGSSATWMET